MVSDFSGQRASFQFIFHMEIDTHQTQTNEYTKRQQLSSFELNAVEAHFNQFKYEDTPLKNEASKKALQTDSKNIEYYACSNICLETFVILKALLRQHQRYFMKSHFTLSAVIPANL